MSLPFDIDIWYVLETEPQSMHSLETPNLGISSAMFFFYRKPIQFRVLFLTLSSLFSIKSSKEWTQSMLTPLDSFEPSDRRTDSRTSRHCRGSAERTFTVCLWTFSTTDL